MRHRIASTGCSALIHSTEKTVEEHGDKVSEADRSAIDSAIAELKTELEGEDAQSITDKTNALAQVAMKLGEAVYQDSQTDAGDAPGEPDGDAAGGGDAGDDIVDADFEEVADDDDEDKKSA